MFVGLKANLRVLDESAQALASYVSSSRESISRHGLHLIFMEACDKGMIAPTEVRMMEQTLSLMNSGAALPLSALSPEIQQLAHDSSHKITLLDTLVHTSENRRLAFFSDVDNTLGTFPLGVHRGFEPDQHLSAVLARLSDSVDGRFSFVTGRPDLFLSTAFSDVSAFRASEFGAVITHWDRDEGAFTLNDPIQPNYTAFEAAIATAFETHPDVLQNCFMEEAKVTSRTLALTDAPSQSAAIKLLKPIAQQFVADYNRKNPSRFPLVAHVNDAAYNCTLEITPENLGDKLRCIRTLMIQPALRDVLPVAMGDSGPDGPMLDCAKSRGGISISVGSKLPSLGHNATTNLAAPSDLQLVLEAFVWSKAGVHPVDRGQRLAMLQAGDAPLHKPDEHSKRAVLRSIRKTAAPA